MIFVAFDMSPGQEEKKNWSGPKQSTAHVLEAVALLLEVLQKDGSFNRGH